MLNRIKKVVLEVAKEYGVEVDKIILFGSRARGDYRKDSDWDILIVTKEKLDEKLKWRVWEEIMFRLRRVDVDIFITDSESLKSYGKVPGTLERYSLLEGIQIW